MGVLGNRFVQVHQRVLEATLLLGLQGFLKMAAAEKAG